jgi:hypothetical protein
VRVRACKRACVIACMCACVLAYLYAVAYTPGFENALFSIDPLEPSTWRALDLDSSDPSASSDPSEGRPEEADGRFNSSKWRPRARARLAMVGAPGGLYVFGGHGESLLPYEDYISTGPWDGGSARYGAWPGDAI